MNENHNSKLDYSSSYKNKLITVIQNVSDKEIAAFIEVLLNARKHGSMVYFIGNGGSASTASHFVNDLSIGTKSLKNPFCAISLCDNQSVLTAISNDYGYDYVFSHQLAVLLKENDVLVTISASGNSPNIIKALAVAKEKGAVTVGLTGFNGGKVKNLVDVSVHVPTEQGEYGLSEDAHMMLDHLVTTYLMNFESED